MSPELHDLFFVLHELTGEGPDERLFASEEVPIVGSSMCLFFNDSKNTEVIQNWK